MAYVRPTREASWLSQTITDSRMHGLTAHPGGTCSPPPSPSSRSRTAAHMASSSQEHATAQCHGLMHDNSMHTGTHHCACPPIHAAAHVPTCALQKDNITVKEAGTCRREDKLLNHVDLVQVSEPTSLLQRAMLPQAPHALTLCPSFAHLARLPSAPCGPQMLDIVDLEAGTAVAGGRGYYLKREGVLLNQVGRRHACMHAQACFCSCVCACVCARACMPEGARARPCQLPSRAVCVWKLWPRICVGEGGGLRGLRSTSPTHTHPHPPASHHSQRHRGWPLPPRRAGAHHVRAAIWVHARLHARAHALLHAPRDHGGVRAAGPV